jgi:hypothetical protein
MVLESFDNRIDIKQLNIEQPSEKPEPAFLPERDITSEQVEFALKSLRDLSIQGFTADNIAGVGGSTALMFPELKEEIRTNLVKEKISRRLRELLSKVNQDQPSNNYPVTGEMLRILANCRAFMEAADSSFITQSSTAQTYAKKLIENSLRFGDWGIHLTSWAQTRLVWSRELSPMATWDQQGLKDLVLQHLKDTQDSFNFARNAANLRIVAPEKFSEIQLNKDMWQYMRQTLRGKWSSGQSNDARDFMEMAKNMTILSAQEISIDNTGLRLVFPKLESPLVRQEGVPEQRNF